MPPQLQRKTAVFVIRIWAEYLQEQPPLWRGEARQVLTGEFVSFRSLAELWQFLETEALTAANPTKEQH